MVSLFLFLGTGCAVSPTTIAPVPEPVSVTGLLGVASSVEEGGFVLQLHDGSEEHVRTSDAVTVGTLVTIDGVRDMATRTVTASSVVASDDRSLVVTSPLVDATVTSPLVVFGFSRVPSGVIGWSILDADQQEVQSGIVSLGVPSPSSYEPFRIDIMLPVLTSYPFTLQLFERPDADVATVSVPLRVLTTDTTTFSVYFPNQRKGSDQDCLAVFPVSRTVAKTSAVGRASLLTLLAGPTFEERAEGYFTSIPAGTSLRSLAVSNGQATADFTGTISSVAGSCLVGSIRAQLSSTLSQFPSVDDIRISVNGREDTALQP